MVLEGLNNTPGGERNREGLYSLQKVQKIRNYEQVQAMALSPKNFKG